MSLDQVINVNIDRISVVCFLKDKEMLIIFLITFVLYQIKFFLNKIEYQYFVHE